MKKIGLWLAEIRVIICYWMGCALSGFRTKKHWVITERGYEARDNAYFMYQYIKRVHPEQRVYYLIDRNSADYDRVKEDSVQFGSLKSYILLASAEKLISTHYSSGIPIMSTKLFRLLGLHKKLYFMQHGITKDDLPTLYGSNAPMRLFICGAKPEYEYVKQHFGHPEGVVQYTGLARYDRLQDASKRHQILVMPTWRQYVTNEQAFLASDYFKYWQSLLQNPQLIEALEQTQTRLLFYVHYEMQPYAHFFSSQSEQIVIAKFEEYDVLTLLKESALLVTDYSSVFFDFAYMGKPVVYYQFDEEEYHKGHYNQGYFDYRTMGFGKVCVCEEDVVSALLKVMDQGMQQEKRYADRVEAFFPIRDTNNCQRIYQCIVGDVK